MFYFKDDKALTVYFSNGDIAVWNKSNPVFDKIHELCINQQWIEIEILNNKAKAILTNDVKVTEEGNIVIKDVVLETTKDDPLLAMIKLLQDKGLIEDDIEKVKPFIINMLKNKHINAVNEIYEYCKAMDFEITEDGCFLAYKNVNADYSSIYDHGKTKHAIGMITKVDKFDTNRSNLCSQGLHFCSKAYLSQYIGNTTIIVKINPEHVCSIPLDYDFTKGRCTEYMMVGVMAKNGTLATTNLKAATSEKVLKTSKEKQVKIKATSRLEETVQNMDLYFGDVKKVAEVMNISVETVKRNLRKVRAAEKES